MKGLHKSSSLKYRILFLEAIDEKILALEANPRPPGCKKLKGKEGWRIRVGDYRIIYKINDGILLVLVIEIGDRKNIYRKRQIACLA